MRIPFISKQPHTLPNVRIRHRLPLASWLVIGVCFLLLLGAAFFFGQRSNSYTPFTTDQSELQHYLSKLDREHQRLKQVAQAAAVNLEIEKSTQRRLLERLNAVETENAGLKQELGFLVKLRRNDTTLSNS